MILLDTDVCVEILRHNPRILARFRAVQREVRIPFMTAAELLYGAEKSDDPDRNREQVEELLSSVEIVESDENTIRTFGYVKAYLVRAGRAIPDADILVAAAALSRSCALATGNVRHFSRIWGLQLQDWFAATPQSPARRAVEGMRSLDGAQGREQ